MCKEQLLTTKDIEIELMYKGGWKIKDIAKKYGCSLSTIQYHLKKAGVEKRSSRDYNSYGEATKKTPLPDTSVMASMYERGLPLKSIAESFGCSVSTVRSRLIKNGTQIRNNGDYPVTDRQREARRENGAKSKGTVRSDETKSRISTAKKQYRKRDDYEFGGHETKRKDGYVKVFVPDHPHATSDGFVMKHTLVMERELGRLLAPGEVVHHINHIRDDNRIENLELMTIKEHSSLHSKERWNTAALKEEK